MLADMRLSCLLVYVLSHLVCAALAQNVPHIACPQYFEYMLDGEQLFGRIELKLEHSTNELQVQFSQRTPITTGFSGSLTLLGGEEQTNQNLLNGRPIEYRVDFPTPYEVPKLVAISLNGELLCSTNGYPPPSTAINLKHNLRSSTVVFYPSRSQAMFPQQNPFVYEGFVGPAVNNATPTRAPMPQLSRINSRPVFVNPSAGNQFSRNPFFTQSVRMRPAPTPRPVAQMTDPPQQQLAPSVPTRTDFSVATNQDVNAECGIEGNNITPFIHLGTTVARGQFPWLTAIYQKLPGATTKFICGGSLLSRRTVITAAHCVKRSGVTADRVLVYLGRHNLDDYNGIVPREVQEMLPHPQYNEATIPDADIALVYLQATVVYTREIRPICLWHERFGMDIPQGMKGAVAGWGRDEGGNEITSLPKIADAEIVSENECLRTLQIPEFTSNRTLCAGNRDGSGPCMGDSGGGLMINYQQVWVLRAIVSVGQLKNQNCNLSEYVIYCDVAKHIAWVRSNVRD